MATKKAPAVKTPKAAAAKTNAAPPTKSNPAPALPAYVQTLPLDAVHQWTSSIAPRLRFSRSGTFCRLQQIGGVCLRDREQSTQPRQIRCRAS